MKPFLICLAALIAPFAMGACPAILEGVNGTLDVDGFEEVMDTACGRRNFTSLFWSQKFRSLILLRLSGLGETPESFKPFMRSLRAKLITMKTSDAKAYVDELISSEDDYVEGQIDSVRLIKYMIRLPLLGFSRKPSAEAQIEIAQTLKAAFGFEESDQMKKERIETAMTTINNIDEYTSIAKFFTQMYLLAKERSRETGYFSTPTFGTFYDWMDKEWNVTGISPLEIAPAVETLYLQHRTLNNTQAKRFVDWVLYKHIYIVHLPYTEYNLPTALRQAREVVKEDNELEVFRACSIENAAQCFRNLPDDVQSALTSTFPELANYLSTTDWFEKRMAKLSKIDGSFNVQKKSVPHYRRTFISDTPAEKWARIVVLSEK